MQCLPVRPHFDTFPRAGALVAHVHTLAGCRRHTPCCLLFCPAITKHSPGYLFQHGSLASQVGGSDRQNVQLRQKLGRIVSSGLHIRSNQGARCLLLRITTLPKIACADWHHTVWKRTLHTVRTMHPKHAGGVLVCQAGGGLVCHLTSSWWWAGVLVCHQGKGKEPTGVGVSFRLSPRQVSDAARSLLLLPSPCAPRH